MLDMHYDARKQINRFNWTNFLKTIANDPKNAPKIVDAQIQAIIQDYPS